MPHTITPGELQGDGYPFEAVILSGEPITTFWRARFVIDLNTLKYHKPRCAVDYNHNDENIIGYGENFQVTPEGLKSSGKLVAGSFADTLVELSKQGVPFEASVDVELDSGIATEVSAGNTITVNGREHSGPLTVYSNVPLRGYAICPHGADKFTNLTLLKKEHEFLMSKPKKMTTPTTKLSDDAAPEAPPEKKVKDPVLAEFCEVFGNEKGLELYQSDANIDEVRQWKALNEKFAQYLSDDEKKETAEDTDPPADAGEKKEDAPADPPAEPSANAEEKKKDDDKLSATLSALNKNIETLTKTVETQAAELVKLKSAIPKGAEPVSHGSEVPPATKANSVANYSGKYSQKK